MRRSQVIYLTAFFSVLLAAGNFRAAQTMKWHLLIHVIRHSGTRQSSDKARA